MIVTIQTIARINYSGHEGIQAGHVAINSEHVVSISTQPVKTIQSDDPNAANTQDVFVDIRMSDGQVITAYLGDLQNQSGAPREGSFINALVDKLNKAAITS